MSSKQITVLGGSGFLGSELSDLLAKRNYKVIIFDIKKKSSLKINQKFIKGSVLNIKKLSKAIKGSRIVLNFAAFADMDLAIDKPVDTIKINILGTINALILCKKFKVKKFIHASSIYANSEQGGFYGSSKKAAEDYIEKFYQKFKIKFTILRFGSLYGLGASKNNGVNKIIDEALKNNTLSYKGSILAARRYVHVTDATRACLKSISRKYDNKYLNITGKKQIKIKFLMKLLAKIIKIKNSDIKYHNLKMEGHYINTPKKFKPRQGSKLMLKKYINFEKSLKEQIIERRKRII